MQTKPPLWEQPYGKGLVLLMSMFAFLGLMSGWMLLEVDFLTPGIPQGACRGRWCCRPCWR